MTTDQPSGRVLPETGDAHSNRGDDKPLTVRLQSGSVLIADDTGAAAHIADATMARSVRASLGSATLTHTSRSVAATLTLAEAAHAEPTPTQLEGVSVRAPAMTSTTIPIQPHTVPPNPQLNQVLSQRRSGRSFGPLAAGQLLPLLADVIRTREVAVTAGGDVLMHRLSPSAGARHPIELVLWARAVSGLEPGPWLLDADGCRVHRLTEPALWRDAVAACDAAGAWSSEPPGALVLLIADFTVTTARYRGGSTLVWRDAGALAATLHLYVGAAGLPNCVLGVGGPVSTECSAELGYGQDHLVGLVGAVAVGGPLPAGRSVFGRDPCP